MTQLHCKVRHFEGGVTGSPDDAVADGKGEEAHGRQEVHAHVPLQLYVPLVRILQACKALKRESRSFSPLAEPTRRRRPEPTSRQARPRSSAFGGSSWEEVTGLSD